MPLLDFADCPVFVAVGGRRFVCRPPTVHTVAVFLDRFGFHVAAICKAIRDGVAFAPEEILQHLVAEETRGSTVAVLSTCVTCQDLDLAEATGSDVVQLRVLAAAVARFINPKWFVSVTGLDRALDEVSLSDEKPSVAAEHQSDAVCFVAAHFGVAPTAVLNWPYTAFIEAGNHLNRLAAQRMDSDSSSGITVVPGVPMEGIIFEKGA